MCSIQKDFIIVHTYGLTMYQTKVHRKLDQVLSMIPHAEDNSKKETQNAIVLRALGNQKEPRKPVEIATITGIPQASTRRIIRVWVHLGKVQRNPNNRYSIIK